MGWHVLCRRVILVESGDLACDSGLHVILQNSVKINHAAVGTACLGALWSLAVEEQFYLVIPAVVRFFSRRGLLLILWSAIIFAPLSRVLLHYYLLSHPAAPYMLTACRADALAMGVLLARGWRSERWRTLFYRYQVLLCGTCLALACAFLYLAIWKPSQYSLEMYSWGFSVVDAFFASLLAIAVLLPGGKWAAVCRSPFLAEIGRVSYCLYVIHAAVDLACHELFFHSLPRFDSLGAALVSIVAAALAYGLAEVSWKFFEHPLLRRGHALKY
ncbi:MAG: acyltransferase [Candidatus Acidiferrales bacterium]